MNAHTLPGKALENVSLRRSVGDTLMPGNVHEKFNFQLGRNKLCFIKFMTIYAAVVCLYVAAVTAQPPPPSAT